MIDTSQKREEERRGLVWGADKARPHVPGREMALVVVFWL